MGDGGPQPIGSSSDTMLEMGIGHKSTKKKKNSKFKNHISGIFGFLVVCSEI
jgi:hypothetical protein